jgi:hypothetical protein
MKKLVVGVPALVLLLSVMTVLAAPAFAASEQVVFSGTGSGTFGGTATPVGFWIWCQATNPNPPYVGNCNGAMTFNALSTTKHVMEGSITEIAEGQYQIVVLSSDGTVNCTLVNSPPPVSGPHNTVTISCSAPSGSGTSTSAVVNVTGP